MAHLVLTVVGDDREGLVQALADLVSAHGANWERSELAELAGAFAGIVQVSVPDDRVDELTDALSSLEGLLRVVPHHGSAPSPDRAPDSRPATFTVLGNDRPGIVQRISTALARHGLSVDRLTSRTLEAPMSGGALFEATVEAHGTPAAVEAATDELEQIAAEIQVDLTFG